ncbi:hypothetical protein PAE3501a [Pyrobaculum aerophilum str. IM2]|uniref:Uncharacterized protein n=1 Tax=Pyrobaculum aerophilum (strain ATCC 51768 / DSM 7523 / JCM 9630 / CIP 104966 / NBRC 100827 / IM2) TaxID=178306 RepID=Q8ZSZ9_PYRAE|nr:hypothetical protein PAE3501a [Pyrobaculum aerophilum str. IM2]
MDESYIWPIVFVDVDRNY